ncbi:MAG TPA: multicopper oxidase [Ktedonobacteraceae bacterium]|nr:multicopper oxidase [Ktedonobacteraceae bacterium]
MMASRRLFLKVGALAGIGAVAAVGEGLFLLSHKSSPILTTQTPQVPLAGAKIPQFVEPLPTFAGSRVKDTSFTISMQEFQQKVLPERLYAGLKSPFNAGTYLWGYQVDNRPAHYPAYTIESVQSMPTTITYVNDLPDFTKSQLGSLLTVDQTIHWADPLKQMGSTKPYQGPVPTVPHMHGAEVPSLFDGVPNQWFTQDGMHGKGYNTFAATPANSAIYRYPNTQPATTMWFHDHALGMTRLSVFAGLAGFYLLRNQYDTGLPGNPLNLPIGHQEVELLIQDRQFDTNGQLLFPNGTPAKNPTGLNGGPPNPSVHPYWIPEFFGDAIVVNGKTWPYLEVEPRRYRFRILNGSNARFYKMRLVDAKNNDAGPAFWQIGTDGGLLDRPALLNDPHDNSSLQLLLSPGERADIIIDFAKLQGRSFTLVNSAPAPYPGGDKPDAATTARIMQFRVTLPLSGQDTTYDPAQGLSLRGGVNQPTALVKLADMAAGTLAYNVEPTVKRQLVLVEVEGPGGPVEVLLNNTKWTGIREGTTTAVAGGRPDGMGQGDYVTELPRVGSTEEWEIVNLTEDAHPIHLHLVQFQLINRQEFDVEKYRAKYDSLFPGGTYAGLKSDHTWGNIQYKPGVYIPGYGPPLPYSAVNGGNAVGGNPDVIPYLKESITPPDVNEAGWKDTMKMYPEQVTRIVVRWAPTEVPIENVQAGKNMFAFDPTTGPGYVWHCHILDHEDNEMMRPFAPVP